MGIWEAIWKSAILGTVQGLTEFLPVSSSGHLTLLQQILGYNLGVAGMTFVNILLHFGTLLSVIFVFWKDILALFKKPFKTILMLIVATVPAGVQRQDRSAFRSRIQRRLALLACGVLRSHGIYSVVD